MTYLINHWQIPAHVVGVQTTRHPTTQKSATDLLDVHPNQVEQSQIDDLINHYQLPHTPFFMQQEHGSQVVEFQQQPKQNFQFNADACFTRTPNVICAVMTADCLPILITDEAGSFVAAVHCGWRSLYKNILSTTLQAINPDGQVKAWLGPCIQQDQYEVDEEFVTSYLIEHPDAGCAFTPIIKNKSQASLYQMAEVQLFKLGIKQITRSDECTFLNHTFFSWRRDKTPHRMGSLIWLQGDQ